MCLRVSLRIWEDMDIVSIVVCDIAIFMVNLLVRSKRTFYFLDSGSSILSANAGGSLEFFPFVSSGPPQNYRARNIQRACNLIDSNVRACVSFLGSRFNLFRLGVPWFIPKCF